MVLGLIDQLVPTQTVNSQTSSRQLDVDKLQKRTYEVLPEPDVVNVEISARYLIEILYFTVQSFRPHSRKHKP